MCVVDLMIFSILCVSIRFEDGSESEGDYRSMMMDGCYRFFRPRFFPHRSTD